MPFAEAVVIAPVEVAEASGWPSPPRRLVHGRRADDRLHVRLHRPAGSSACWWNL